MESFDSSPPTHGPDVVRSPGGRASVWVVDDSPLQTEVIREALASRFEHAAFTSGAAVLERLASGEAPDVLILDWYMPDLSGADVCRFIRATINSAQLPILVLTAIGTTDDLIEALASGANDFVNKPVSDVELNARVAGLVRLTKLHSRLSETERKLRLEAVFRERFMGMLAHDLRQPLSTVVMGCQALAGLQVSDAAAAVIARQLRAAERMQRMVTDLLESTRQRPESGMPMDRSRTDFAAVARASLDEIRSAHADRELELSVEGLCHGHWDADRLAQILSNLIGNALAHGARDGRVDVRLTGSEEAVELRVVNRGEPITKEAFETLSQPFSRSGDVRRSGKGSGLGLRIVHHIVAAHGGTLAAESQAGETHVIVRLPREASDESLSQPSPPH
jgi:signal transduction histidine kinase